jgi:hypothetical protein
LPFPAGFLYSAGVASAGGPEWLHFGHVIFTPGPSTRQSLVPPREKKSFASIRDLHLGQNATFFSDMHNTPKKMFFKGLYT